MSEGEREGGREERGLGFFGWFAYMLVFGVGFGYSGRVGGLSLRTAFFVGKGSLIFEARLGFWACKIVPSPLGTFRGFPRVIGCRFATNLFKKNSSVLYDFLILMAGFVLASLWSMPCRK